MLSLIGGVRRLDEAACEANVLQFLLQALAMHTSAFGRPGDVAASLFEAAFKIGSFRLASCFTEVRQIGHLDCLPPAGVPALVPATEPQQSPWGDELQWKISG